MAHSATVHVLQDSEVAVVGCVIHLRDVTERMLLEEQMRRMERFVSVAMLASGLHHEIKNPLTALSIHIQLLEENLSSSEPEQQVNEIVGVLKTDLPFGSTACWKVFPKLCEPSTFGTAADRRSGLGRKCHPPDSAAGGETEGRDMFLRPDAELPRVPMDADKFEEGPVTSSSMPWRQCRMVAN